MATTDRKINRKNKKKQNETIEIDEFNVQDFLTTLDFVKQLNKTNLTGLEKTHEKVVNEQLKKTLYGNITTLRTWEEKLNKIGIRITDDVFSEKNISLEAASEIINLTRDVDAIALENKTMMSDIIRIIEGDDNATKS